MIGLGLATRILLATEPVDGRLSFNGLYALVQNRLAADPLSGQVYVFTNRRRNRLKLLLFDGSGLWLCTKRLERGRLGWPNGNSPGLPLRMEQLLALIHGVEIQSRRGWYRARDPALDLWALDEVHFCLHGSRCRMWVPWEQEDPVVWHYPGRKSVGYFGAVRLRDGLGLFQKEPAMFDGVTFWNFLQRLHQVSTQTGRRVIVITDNAKYHHAKLHQEWRQQQAPSFQLDYLPPYSPELNPIERVWKRVRRNCVHNVYFAALRLLVEKVDAQFLRWSEPNAELTRLCAI